MTKKQVKSFDIKQFNGKTDLGQVFGAYIAYRCEHDLGYVPPSEFYSEFNVYIELTWSVSQRREFASKNGIPLGSNGLAKGGSQRSGIHLERWNMFRDNVLALIESDDWFDDIESLAQESTSREDVSVLGWIDSFKKVTMAGLPASGGQPKILKTWAGDLNLRLGAEGGTYLSLKGSKLKVPVNKDEALEFDDKTAQATFGSYKERHEAEPLPEPLKA